MEKKERWQHTTSFNYFFLYDKILAEVPCKKKRGGGKVYNCWLTMKYFDCIGDVFCFLIFFFGTSLQQYLGPGVYSLVNHHNIMIA